MAFPPPSRYLLRSDFMENPAVVRLAEVARSQPVRLTSPLKVSWLVSTQCQLRCRHCWSRHDLPQTSPKILEAVARNLGNANLCRIIISGGEPTLVPDLGRYLQIIKNGGAGVALYTNGLDPLGRSSWLDHWDYERDYVQVSLDGGNRRDFEAQRCQDTFSAFLRGVALFNRRQVRLVAHYIASPFNRGDVHGAARLALDLGCEGFIAEMFYHRGRARDISLKETLATASAFNAAAAALLQDPALVNSPLKLGICFPVTVPFPVFVREAFTGPPPPLRQPLAIGTSSCVVKASGEVFPADFLDHDSAYSCGSLLHAGLAEIWEKAPGFQLLPRERNLSRALCSRCPDYPFCRGGLAERAFAGCGTFAAHDPWCHFSLARTNPGLIVADSSKE